MCRAEFKAHLDFAVQCFGLKGSTLRKDRGVDSFLVDAMLMGWATKEFAARAMASLCEHDGSDGDKVICVAVVSLLEDKFGGQPESDHDEKQRLLACVAVATDPGTYNESLRWIESWFRDSITVDPRPEG